MIASFGDKATERLFADERVSAFEAIARRAKLKLTALHAAARLGDMTVPPFQPAGTVEG